MYVPYIGKQGRVLLALMGLGDRQRFELDVLVRSIELMLQSAYIMERDEVSFVCGDPRLLGLTVKDVWNALKIAERHTGFPGMVELLCAPEAAFLLSQS